MRTNRTLDLQTNWLTPSCVVGPEITACMSVVAARVRQSLPKTIPVGVQVLAAANRSALAVALAADLQFIREALVVYNTI